jgi:perosamine synthetase
LFNQLPAGVSPLFYPLAVENKHEVLERLQAKGIEAIDFWRRFHPTCDAGRYPDTERLRRSVIEVPCHQDLTPEVMTRVANVVREAMLQERRPKSFAAFPSPSGGGP